jgi:1,4-alpha-glucan branching enzyme
MDDKFKQARLLYLYMMTHPGKQLNFMGNELAMLREWDENRQVDWHLTENANHADFLRYITALNRLYCQTPALWSLDHNCEGFKWIENVNENPCVFGYTRTDGSDTILVLLNFSDVSANLSLPKMDMIFATDAATTPDLLPPFGGMVFQCTKE